MFLCVCFFVFVSLLLRTHYFSHHYFSLYIWECRNTLLFTPANWGCWLSYFSWFLSGYLVSDISAWLWVQPFSVIFIDPLNTAYTNYLLKSECRWLEERDGGPVIRANRPPDFHYLCDGMTRRLEELCQSLEACLWPSERVTVSAPLLELSEWLFSERDSPKCSCEDQLQRHSHRFLALYKHLQFYLIVFMRWVNFGGNFSHLIFFL